MLEPEPTAAAPRFTPITLPEPSDIGVSLAPPGPAPVKLPPPDEVGIILD